MMHLIEVIGIPAAGAGLFVMKTSFQSATLPHPKLILHGVGQPACGSMIGPVQWPHFDLIVVTRGSIQYEVDARRCGCGSGDALLIPPRHRFVGWPQEEGCAIWVQHFSYATAASRRLEAAIGGPQHWHMCVVGDWVRALMGRVHELQSDRGDEDRDAGMREARFLFGLLLEALEAADAGPLVGESPAAARVHRVIEWVRNHPLPPIGIEALAGKAKLSASQFRATFHRLTGDSVGRFLRDLRLREASRLLEESNMPIKAISDRMGYSDPVAFHRAFLRKTGHTPARFRARRPKPL